MKRFIALLLSFLLIFCVMPIVSAAEEAPTSVMNVLQELGAQNPKVVRQTRSSNLYDNLENLAIRAMPSWMAMER